MVTPMEVQVEVELEREGKWRVSDRVCVREREKEEAADSFRLYQQLSGVERCK